MQEGSDSFDLSKFDTPIGVTNPNFLSFSLCVLSSCMSDLSVWSGLSVLVNSLPKLKNVKCLFN